MTAPRIEVDLDKITSNTRKLVRQLGRRGIGITGVTKGVCGHPDIARAMLAGGVTRLADARLSNVERMRRAGIDQPFVLIRTPMLSQTDRIVRCCGTSLNTEIEVIRALAQSALRAGCVHKVVLMVELGDGREGIPPEEVEGIARIVARMSGVVLTGIGSNFACLSKQAPVLSTIAELSALVTSIENGLGNALSIVSGGGSANLDLAFGSHASMRVNDLRLGEAILLGRDPLSQKPINGLFSDAFTLVAEVIEADDYATMKLSKLPSWNSRQPEATSGKKKAILAIGDQDTDIEGLEMPNGFILRGSTSDHMVVAKTGSELPVGTEVAFQLNYSALMRAMRTPDVTCVVRDRFTSFEPENSEGLCLPAHLA